MIPFTWTSNTTFQHNDYYNVPRYDGLTAKEMQDLLKERHYVVPISADKNKLQQALIRSDLGMMSYHNLDGDEMRALLTARKVEGGTGGAKHTLMHRLEMEDRNPKFYRFQELAAELRISVYEFHFAGFTSAVVAPSQPPISRASQVLRHETLPMFYRLCTFDFQIRERRNQESLHDAHAPGELKIPPQMRLFLSCTPLPLLACITKLEISIVEERPRRRNVFVRMELSAGLRPGAVTGVSVPWDPDQPYPPRGEVATRKTAAALVEVKKVVRKIAKRSVRKGFRIEDFFDLRKAIEMGRKHT